MTHLPHPVAGVGMDRDYARLLTDRIKRELTDLAPLVTEAYTGQAWAALGYESWSDYVFDEFGGPLRLGRAERQEAVARLRQGGLSTRAIGDVLGVGHSTVVRDTGSIGPNGPMLPDTIQTTDGRAYPATRPDAPKWNPGAIMTSDSVEWYTPGHIVAAVVKALDGIDLDPCADAGHAVPATMHYTIDDDGLAQGWRGRVYMNPPYGREIGDWIEKLVGEYEMGNVAEAIALVPSRCDTAWFVRIARIAEGRCDITGRLSFSGADPAPFPSTVFYLGPDPSAFHDVFGPLGLAYQSVVRKLAAVAAA